MRLLTLFASRQETDDVVLSDEAALGKHPRTSGGCFFVFGALENSTRFSAPLALPLPKPLRQGKEGQKNRQERNAEVRKKDTLMKVVVQDNQIEKAIRDLKKKLTKEGFFSEIKERRFYDKPSVQRKKKQAKAAKRRRKRMRKVY